MTTRTFQDKNFLVWEVFPSAGRHGYSHHSHVVFHCLTQRDVRPRYFDVGSTEADAQRLIGEASEVELLDMLERARDIA
jgi:hypothetical protein